MISGIKSKYANYRLNKINKMENSINGEEGSIKAAPNSPKKIMPDKLKITLRTLPKQLSIAKNMENSVKSLKNNPEKPQFSADADFIHRFEEYALSLGIDKIKYVKIPPELIFRDKSVLFENAIIFIMEMDKPAIDKAPSDDTQSMSVTTYDELGKKTNQLAEFLRENGFAAQASHPAGGFVIYPQLAQQAGLGYMGRHGMLITPEFGPRQRISAIFTSIENLTFANENVHSWIPDFCQKCSNCIKKCPGNAIIEVGSYEAGDLITKIIKDLCHGCTICMRECSFNKRDYNHIKSKVERII
ncbi:MAG: electron transport complex protein RnfB [Methanobacterium sp. PtaU1.Bin242]|nr:MAG: electron transport complex protein RnfB [Methanobacterium sp. PtaU1.Bin242]